MHTDDSRLGRPQHLAGAQRFAIGERRSETRQHQPAAHELGDPTEPDDEPGFDHWDDGQRVRLYEGEDALTTLRERRGVALAQRGAPVVQCFAVFQRDGTNSASSSGTSTRISS